MLRSMKAEHTITVHRFEATLFPVNAYLVETDTSVIVVDATLGVSDGKTLRSRVEALRKPLAAIIITHAHPDHYGGVSALLGEADVPVYAAAGVNDVIRRDDAAKEQILRPMFGDEWPATRRFPSRIVQGGERVTIADAVFSVTDLGPGESPHDSLWRLESDGSREAFVGDLVYSHMHAFLADGFTTTGSPTSNDRLATSRLTRCCSWGMASLLPATRSSSGKRTTFAGSWRYFVPPWSPVVSKAMRWWML